MKKGILLLCFLACLQSFAQAPNNVLQEMERFRVQKLKDPFPPFGNWKDINETEFDFNKIESPTIIRFGFHGCAPCRFEMPTFIKLSKEYPNINFLYITYDDKNELKEYVTKDYKDAGNMRYLSVPKTYIDGYRLVLVYPTTYFIQSVNKVIHLTSGGNVSDEAKVYKTYKHAIDSVFVK